MTQDGTYNGWTNRDTWAAHLWLTDKDERTYRNALEVVAGGMGVEMRLQALIESLGNPDGIDYQKVDWGSVIAALR